MAEFTPTCWETVGCSYIYNASWAGIWGKYDTEGYLSGQKTTWVAKPSTHILMYEPPATVWGQDPLETSFALHWHYVNSPVRTLIGDVSGDGNRFISPILYVDGHSANRNFTRSIKADPYYSNEETADWTWYQAVKPTTASRP